MFPVNPAKPYSRFQRSVKDQQSESYEDVFEKTKQKLKRRLDSIRDRHDFRPFTGLTNISSEDHEVLNNHVSKKQRYGIFCPECHEQYKKMEKNGRNIVIYRPPEQQIDKKM